ncbi:MAG: hypothetical protein AAF739_17595 [Pseudomonadota bacterium]
MNPISPCLRLLSALRPALFSAVLASSVAAATPAAADQTTYVRDIFYSSMSNWEDYLDFADDLQEVVWTHNSFSELQTWQMWLHNAITSENRSFEALAQSRLLDLGMTEGELVALYHLDPRVFDESELAVFRFSQRAGVLPVRVNPNDINALRLHFDEREIVDIMVLNSYGAKFNVIYGTGFVSDPALHPEMAVAGLTPDLIALRQKKQETSSGFERRQFFESPILSPQLSAPYLGMDWLMFNEHEFDVATSWEFFMVGMRASDCKHCQTHAALGMLYEGRDHERIQDLYRFETDRGASGAFTAREIAMYNFVRSATQLPTQMNTAVIRDTERHFNRSEIDHLIGVSGVIAFLSNYMQISAVVTDQESVNFAEKVLAPLGWHLGRHAGWPEEQRAMHPTTLHRLTEGQSAMDKNLVFYRNAFQYVLVNYWFDRLAAPAFLIAFQVALAFAFLGFYRRRTTVMGASGPTTRSQNQGATAGRLIAKPQATASD